MKMVMIKFDAFFKVHKNNTACFNKKNLQNRETAEEYLMELYTLAESCEYGDMKHELIDDRLAIGILNAYFPNIYSETLN